MVVRIANYHQKIREIKHQLCYNQTMSKETKNNQLLAEAVHLQAMEDNPLDRDQIAMFEMFEREGWTHEKRLAHIKERAKSAAMIPAAE